MSAVHLETECEEKLQSSLAVVSELPEDGFGANPESTLTMYECNLTISLLSFQSFSHLALCYIWIDILLAGSVTLVNLLRIPYLPA